MQRFAAITITLITFLFRKHVLTDLQPYACTFPDCGLHERIFESRDEWFNHELQIHRLEWFCNTESHEAFGEIPDFIAHMRDMHQISLDLSQSHMLRHAFQRPSRSLCGICTLCGRYAQKLKTHLSHHLEQLSLFAIPQTDYMSDLDTEEIQSDIARQSVAASLSKFVPEDSDSSASSPIPEKVTNAQDVLPRDENLTLSNVEEIPEETLQNFEDTVDTSWDNITSKFQEARTALYKDQHQDLASPHRTTPVQEGTTSISQSEIVVSRLYQRKPLCGASIGAFRGGHLPPISLGGIILVDEKPYGMTCHHFLDAPDDYDESEDYLGNDTSDDNLPDAVDTGTPTQAPDTGVKPDTMTPDVGVLSKIFGIGAGSQTSPAVDISDADDLHQVEQHDNLQQNLRSKGPAVIDDGDLQDFSVGRIHRVGDIEGIKKGDGTKVLVTQPALDDTDSSILFPKEVGKGDAHLELHKFGHIHASSGVKRFKKHGKEYEIDWALIEIDHDRLYAPNVILGGMKFCKDKTANIDSFLVGTWPNNDFNPEEDEVVTEIEMDDDIGGRRVHIMGRTSGLQGKFWSISSRVRHLLIVPLNSPEGVISDSMGSFRLYGRKTFSRHWYMLGNGGKFSLILEARRRLQMTI